MTLVEITAMSLFSFFLTCKNLFVSLMFLRDFIALDRSFLTNGSFCEEVLCWWRYHVFGDGVGEGGGSDLFRICYLLIISLIFVGKL